MSEEASQFRAVRTYVRSEERRRKALDQAVQDANDRLAEIAARKHRKALEDAAAVKGLRSEQVDYLARLVPDLSPAHLDEAAEVFGVHAGSQGFTPSSGGSHVPPTPYSDEDFGAALKAGDKAAITRMSAAATKDPRRLTLKYAHLIEDD